MRFRWRADILRFVSVVLADKPLNCLSLLVHCLPLERVCSDPEAISSLECFQRILVIMTIIICWASDTSNTPSLLALEVSFYDDNPESVFERNSGSRGGGNTRMEAAAGESDDDGVFNDHYLLGVASTNSATSEATACSIATLYLVWWCVGVYLKTCLAWWNVLWNHEQNSLRKVQHISLVM